MEEAEPEVKKQEAEPEGAAETSVEEAENKEEAVESGDVAEGDVPAEEVSVMPPRICLPVNTKFT